MEFFNGSIEQAVTLSKSKNAVFVVFVEGPSTEEKSKLRELIDDAKIRSKLQSDDFVVIKVTSDSQAYMQFAAIYQVVPVPSLFFIGRSGQPLHIATDILNTPEELEEKVQLVLKLSGKTSPQFNSAGASSSSSAFIAAEKVASAAVPAKEEAKADDSSSTAAKDDVVTEAAAETAAASPATEAAVETKTETAAAEEPKTEQAAEPPVDDKAAVEDVDMQEAAPEPTPAAPAVDIPKPKETPSATSLTKSVETKAAPAPAKPTAVASAAQQRSPGISPVQSQDSIKRPQVVDLKEQERLKKEQELKELKDSIKRERLLEQQARERIRAQIAGDRAERAQRKEDNDNNASNTAANRAPSPSSIPLQKSKTFSISDPDNTCLQFRLPTGDHHTHIFQASQLLSDVRGFVKMDLLSGSGVRDFYLATSYPRREFGVEDDERTLLQLGLVPNAVILVIAKESKISPANIVARSGGILNLLSSLMTMIFTPFYSAFDYLRSYFRKRPAEDRVPEEAAHDAAKRRNLDSLNMGPSTSRAAALGDLSRALNISGSNAAGIGAGGGQSSANGNLDATKPYRRFGGPNIHRLTDARKDSDDENATWNGNSTQQQ